MGYNIKIIYIMMALSIISLLLLIFEVPGAKAHENREVSEQPKIIGNSFRDTAIEAEEQSRTSNPNKSGDSNSLSKDQGNNEKGKEQKGENNSTVAPVLNNTPTPSPSPTMVAKSTAVQSNNKRIVNRTAPILVKLPASLLSRFLPEDLYQSTDLSNRTKSILTLISVSFIILGTILINPKWLNRYFLTISRLNKPLINTSKYA